MAAAGGGSAGSIHVPEDGRPRLMILKMVLENFKSYGGVKEIGPFHKSFSSVVGPNGSGKSNVIDAMLFVFGKKANKMRLNKVSELIHKSAAYPDLDFCRVSVYFQVIVDDPVSADAYTVVPGSEFIITRTADRGNQSKYFVDGRVSSFSEVQKLLKDKHGIDLDNNRFLILQGEVEQISMMKAKASTPSEEGLLEYLEDIIGSNQYVSRIADAEKLLIDLESRRGDQLNRVRVIEKEKGGLESAKTEAEAVMSKTRAILRQKGLLAQKVASELDVQVTKAEETHASVSELLTTERASLSEVQSNLDKLKTAAAEAGKVHDAIVQEVSQGEHAMQLLERRDKVAEQNIKDAVASVQKLTTALERDTAALADAKTTVENARKNIPLLEAKLIELGAEKTREEGEYERVMAALQGETAAIRKELETRQAALAPAAQAASKAQLQVDAVKSELRLLKERLESAGREAENLAAQIRKIDGDAGGKAAELNAAKAEAADMSQRKGVLEAELAAVTRAEAEAAERLRAARSKVEEGRAALASEEGKGGMVKALMAQSKPGGALAGAGLHGRLGDLGAIDPKYDVAISTACGALNWLVVETTEGGQQCVEFLRTSGLGRAKFICLDKIRWIASRMAAPFTAPERVPRLFDLVVTRNEAYKIAFYFALKDTLVSETMDQAVRIAYTGGRATHRVVTLSGELIDTSGTMSGGGKSARRGGMAAALAPEVTPEEMAAAEAELAASQAALTDARARKGGLGNDLREVERVLPRLVPRITKLEMEMTAMVTMRDDLSKRLAAIQAGGASSAVPSPEETARAEELLGSLPGLEGEAARLAAAATALESEITKLKRQVLEVGGEKVRRAKARHERAAEAVHEVEKALVKAKSDIKAGEKTIEKTGKAIEKAEREREELVAAAQKQGVERKAIEEEAVVVAQRLEEAKGRLAAAKQAVTAASTSLTAAEKDSKIRRERERELAAELATAETALKDLKKKLHGWQEQLKSTAIAYEKEIAELVAELEADAELNGDEEEEVAPGAAGGAGGAAGGGVEGGAPPPPPEGEGMTDALATAAGGVEIKPIAPKKPRINLKEPAHLPTFTAAELAPLKAEQLQSQIDTMEAERKALSSKVNYQAIQEFRTKEREYLRRVAELDAVTTARDTSKAQLEGYKKARLEEFMKGFAIITLRLKEMYQMITLGGDAELELVDSLDPFSEGIVFSVRPPKKSWKNIANLSGGEKTLSSLALVFALHHYKPTPLYVMDEIDAALDFKNVSIVANYIKERTKDAQFIIISLRNNMFELADRLVGIYKTHDVTKSITINPKTIAADTGLEDPASTGVVAAAGGGGSKAPAPPPPPPPPGAAGGGGGGSASLPSTQVGL